MLRELLVVCPRLSHKPALVTAKKTMLDHARQKSYVDTITDFKVVIEHWNVPE